MRSGFFELSPYVEGCSSRSREYVSRFLAWAGCDPGGIRRSIGRQFGEIHDILYVSTITNGLAGSTSDIDVILVVADKDLAVERMSTRIFSGSRRIGVTAYSHREIVEAISRVRALEPLPASEVQRTRAAWDGSQQICWTDLIRCINGYSFESSMPYLDGLPALSVVTYVTAFEQFRRAVALCWLSAAAQERRGCQGYALTALRELMDAFMARYGQVNSGAKWVFERWQRFESASGNPSGSLRQRISRELRATIASLKQPSQETSVPSDVGARMLDLYHEACALQGVDIVEDRSPLYWRDELDFLPFVENTSFVGHRSGKFVLVHAGSKEDFAGFEMVTPSLAAEQASALVALFRAGFVDVPLNTCFTAAH